MPQLQQGRRPATASPAARRQTGGGSNAYEQQFGASAGFQGLSTSATSSLLMSASEVRDLHNRISADNRHRAERMRDHGYLVGDRGRVAIKSPPTKLGVHWRQGGRAGAPVASPAGAGHVAALRKALSGGGLPGMPPTALGGLSGGGGSLGAVGSVGGAVRRLPMSVDPSTTMRGAGAAADGLGGGAFEGATPAGAAAGATFAARRPATRTDTILLCAWLQEQLVKLEDGDESASLRLWDEAMDELARQVTVECAERGRLLELSRLQYLARISKLEAQLAAANERNERNERNEQQQQQQQLLADGSSIHDSPPGSPTSASLGDRASSRGASPAPMAGHQARGAQAQARPRHQWAGDDDDDEEEEAYSQPPSPAVLAAENGEGGAVDVMSRVRHIPGVGTVGKPPPRPPSRRNSSRPGSRGGGARATTEPPLPPGPGGELLARIERKLDDLSRKQISALAHPYPPPPPPTAGSAAYSGYSALGDGAAPSPSPSRPFTPLHRRASGTSSAPLLAGSGGGGSGGGGSGDGSAAGLLTSGGLGSGNLLTTSGSAAALLASSGSAADLDPASKAAEERRAHPGNTERVARLLEEVNTTLTKSEREFLLSDLVDKSPADLRLEALTTLVERLTPTQRAHFFDGAFDHVLRYARTDAVRRAMVGGFGTMLSEEQEHLLASLMRAVPSHRRSEALCSLLDGTSEEMEVSMALASALMHVSKKARRRAFRVLCANPELGLAERDDLASTLSVQRPGFEAASCQTEMSFEEADGRLKAALVAREELEDARIGEWERRALVRVRSYREAVARLDSSRGGDGELSLLYKPIFGTNRPPPVDLPQAELLGIVAELFADKADADVRHAQRSGGGAEPLSMVAFLHSRVENTPEAAKLREQGARCATKQELSSVMHSAARLVTTSLSIGGPVHRLALFCLAASLLDVGDDHGDASVQRLLLGVYGIPMMMKRLMAMEKVVVMLSRDTADAARVNTDPTTLIAYPPPPPEKEGAGEEDDDPWADQGDGAAPAPAPSADDALDFGYHLRSEGYHLKRKPKGEEEAPPPPPPPPPVVSWGSVEEAIANSDLPPHLRSAVRHQATRQSLSYDTLTHIDEPKGVDSDELIEILLDAWRTQRRQRSEMLRERFDASDADADGVLTLPEFWSCLQSLLQSMLAAGGASEAAAEPWRERGQAELLYNQICIEAEFLGVPGAAHKLIIAREAFVNVLMRRRLFDADFSGYLERHPDERMKLK